MKHSDHWLCGIIVAGIMLTALPDRARASGRYVLNQTPQTIERYFGRYWTRLTRTENGVKRVTYTYSPRGLQRIFPNTRVDRFAITFVENRSQSISVAITGSPDELSFTYNRADSSRLYEYIFGYRPPIRQQLSSRFTGNTTIYDYEDCLGDGIATRYTLGGAAQFLLSGAELRYNERCEPPYTR
ncbi:hypothetical protein JOY44_27565 (plasmid) [Phormidium sp. CLA17]|uniref:hypothetical protein n=1 Tax=Leptolyngbya sp. Cla-17 TaxID=2803751 RepID=UPI001932FCDE|nr:hypothetical protein [Leptolyngbya sp. Cla-17]MBM0745234.1 hypothetical protein [Leptolyngbya sp. Cla-17]